MYMLVLIKSALCLIMLFHFKSSHGIFLGVGALYKYQFAFNFTRFILLCLGTAVAQWLRCCAGSIPADISEFFIDKSPGVNSASNRNEYKENFLG